MKDSVFGKFYSVSGQHELIEKSGKYYGNCQARAELYRREFIKRGVPGEWIHKIKCKTPRGTYHLWLKIDFGRLGTWYTDYHPWPYTRKELEAMGYIVERKDYVRK